MDAVRSRRGGRHLVSGLMGQLRSLGCDRLQLLAGCLHIRCYLLMCSMRVHACLLRRLVAQLGRLGCIWLDLLPRRMHIWLDLFACSTRREIHHLIFN